MNRFPSTRGYQLSVSLARLGDSTIAPSQQPPFGPSLRLHSSLKPNALSSNDNNNTDDNSPPPPPSHPQSFVKTHFQRGEYDPKMTNPLHKPPWKNRARIISAEDFADRPRVTFDEEFDSMHDAMVTLTWLTEETRQAMYSDYLSLMVESANDRDDPSGRGKQGRATTSHEYVVNVIAQRYGVTPERIAGVVQNCHDEEQAKGRGEHLHTRAQEFVDAKIREHIDNCYAAYGEVDPKGFVEDPVGAVPEVIDTSLNTRDVARVEDLWDLERLMDKAVKRQQKDAQLKIDNKVYIEDVDLHTVQSKINAECLNLIQTKNQQFSDKLMGFDRTEAHGELPLPYGGIPNKNQDVVERRPRWKYAAKIINTIDDKKLNAKLKNSYNRRKKLVEENKRKNIIVEHDGNLRVASVAEVAGTASKPQRNPLEFIYAGVKQAWMNRQFRGEKGGWGRMTAPPKKNDATPDQKDNEKDGQHNDTDAHEETHTEGEKKDENT